MTCCWCASQFKRTLNKGSRYNCVVERLTALHRRHLREHLSEAFTLFWFTIQKVFFPSVFAHRPPSTTCHFLWRAMKLEKKKKTPTCEHTQKLIRYHGGPSPPGSILIGYQAWLPCRKPLRWLRVLAMWLPGDSWDTVNEVAHDVERNKKRR